MATSFFHIGICDDEPYWQAQIKKLCHSKCSLLKITEKYYIFSTGKELLQSPDWLDILFLDEEMPDISGCAIKEVYESQNRSTMIVFVTSHPEVLYDSFGKNVYGFLHKPLDESKFSKILTKLIEKLSANGYLQLLDPLSGNVKVLYRDILFIQAEGSYSRVHLIQEKSILIRKGLGELEVAIREAYMARIHKSYIANLNYCRSLHASSSTLIMENNMVLPIARRRKNMVLELYAQLSMERAARVWDL